MEFLAEDIAAVEPSDQQLTAYLAANPKRFRTEDRLSFQHVFLSANRRGEALDADAKEVAASLVGVKTPINMAELGDPFLLGAVFGQMSESDIARAFGDAFGKQLAAADVGQWQGPIRSSFGAHFVFVDERTKGSLPPLASVREDVRREWLNARRIEVEEKLYSTL